MSETRTTVTEVEVTLLDGTKKVTRTTVTEPRVVPSAHQSPVHEFLNETLAEGVEAVEKGIAFGRKVKGAIDILKAISEGTGK